MNEVIPKSSNTNTPFPLIWSLTPEEGEDIGLISPNELATIEYKFDKQKEFNSDIDQYVEENYSFANELDFEVDANETDLHFLSMSHDILEQQIDLDPDFLDALNELAIIEGKDSPSKQRF
ncbi:MAG: hypothetical protein ACE5JB_05750 [bacterium]